MRELRPGLVCVAMLLLACSHAPAPRTSMDDADRARAAELYTALSDQQDTGKLDAAAATAREIVSTYPGFAQMDDVLLRAADIAVAGARHADAVRYYDALVRSHPASPLLPRAQIGAARSNRALGLPIRAAENLLQLLSGPIEADMGDAASSELRSLARENASAPQLAELAARYPSSPLSQQLAVGQARSAYARGDYDVCYRQLVEFLYRFPEAGDASEARRLLELVAERRQAPKEALATVVNPDVVAIVFPQTGSLSVYGRAFEQGARLAADEHNANSTRAIRLAVGDSRGDPVAAVRAVRSVVQEEGAVAILGSVFTVPTLAAAIEANAWSVPLLSPVVSADNLGDIGPWVYQTRVPMAVETTAMASLAVAGLKLERLAVIAPALGNRRDLAEFFSAEITRLGSQVVALEFYDDGATDFRDQLERVREAAPDGIFAPGTVEQLLLLLPQVKFYDLQVQMLGLSNWNSDKLLRLSREELEGALFPLEAYRGKDQEEFDRFRAAMLERGISEISPISTASYFGMRLLLRALDEGALTRAEVRSFLDDYLGGSADKRMEEAKSLPILVVRSGHAIDFKPPSSPTPLN